jgi:hypothetical protein
VGGRFPASSCHGGLQKGKRREVERGRGCVSTSERASSWSVLGQDFSSMATRAPNKRQHSFPLPEAAAEEGLCGTAGDGPCTHGLVHGARFSSHARVPAHPGRADAGANAAGADADANANAGADACCCATSLSLRTSRRHAAAAHPGAAAPDPAPDRAVGACTGHAAGPNVSGTTPQRRASTDASGMAASAG